MSLKLTTSLSQRLVLTPQLRQRIEMLQMTTLELSDLIQQQLLENPVLEEVPSQEEVQELAEKVLDHLASSDPSTAEGGEVDATAVSQNGTGDLEALSSLAATAEAEFTQGESAEEA
ncbi:MAG TPA: hypothetical protein VKB46_16215, partial [Pyrinomonadaceae bacterium]|nr:hypothetical protein [Pyrinomonadaceae bacterium]